MSWEEELFGYLDDLEGRAAALYDAERAPEIADRGRAEYRSVSLAARLMASVDLEVTLDLLGAGAVSGRLIRVADGWCLVRGAGPDWVIRLDSVVAAHGTSDRAVPEIAWPVASKLGLGSVFRRLAETGEPCSMHLIDGRRHDGVVRRVGADFVELATGEAGRVALVVVDQVAAVQSRP